MRGLKYFKKSDFEKTNYTYSEHTPLRLKFAKLGKKQFGRLRYTLPNGHRADCSRIPDECETQIRVRARVEKEFEQLLRSGYFLIKDIDKLNEVKTPRKGNNPSIDDAIELYYTKFNANKNEKRAKVIKNEIGCMRYNMNLFKEELHKYYIHDVTSKDLGSYNTGLREWCRNRGRPIKKSTAKSYKKVVKAFWNCMNLHYDLDLNTQKIDLVIYSSGRPDPLAYTRQIHVPPILLDHVDMLVVKTPSDGPNRQDLVYFERRTGLAKEELSTLSEHNLFPNKENFNCLKLINKPDCPVTNQIGFELKTKRREREIPLDKKCIEIINKQLKRHQNDKIYGQTRIDKKAKYIPYRFLFPIFRNGKWLRCDNYLLGIRALLNQANNDFNLGFTDRYTLHDFRRTLNGEMGDDGMPASERAVILGHSEEVNKLNYTNYKRMQALMAQKASSRFTQFLQNASQKKTEQFPQSGNVTTLSENP